MQNGDIVEFKFNVSKYGLQTLENGVIPRVPGCRNVGIAPFFDSRKTAVLRTYSAVLRGDRV